MEKINKELEQHFNNEITLDQVKNDLPDMINYIQRYENYPQDFTLTINYIKQKVTNFILTILSLLFLKTLILYFIIIFEEYKSIFHLIHEYKVGFVFLFGVNFFLVLILFLLDIKNDRDLHVKVITTRNQYIATINYWYVKGFISSDILDYYNISLSMINGFEI